MCFFDTFGTLNKPNVYIEVGMAYAIRVPMILAEYVGGATADGLGGGESIPSDLQGLFRIQYSSYQELFRKLYFGLPTFMSRFRGRQRSRSKR